MPILFVDGMSFSGLAKAFNLSKPAGYFTYHQV